jgi:glyoxylase I family protein
VTGLGRFHHVALTVADAGASAEWYRDVLGLVELFREEGDGRHAVVLGFPGGGHAVGLVSHPSTSGSFDPATTGLDHLSFAVDTRSGLDEWAAHLDSHGVEHSGVIDIPPGAILNFRDPDGIALALFWDR